MNGTTPNTLGRALRGFFSDHLPRVRGQAPKRSRATVIRSSCYCGSSQPNDRRR